ncbi:endoplasmic reticulum mannosyl-oligosaccharide 1,2-alpha-mannosidase [Hydra vulgaris]|uniref:alpha-1,2-Mannosidase n=1 Tax=Hydra vulgaris TaxID=6087 RepID=A0ABM4BCX0_HYDVU
MSVFTPGRLDHSVIDGIDLETYNNDKGHRSTSIYRAWRQQTSQQKIILIFLVFLLLSFVYVFLFKTYVPIKSLEADTKHINHVPEPLVNPLKDNNARQKLIELKNRELNEKFKPLKRGPPNLLKEKLVEHSIQQSDVVGSLKDDSKDFIEFKLINGENEEIIKEREDRKKKLNSPESQNDFAHYPEKISMTLRQTEVVAACQHAWDGYRKFAWGHDELKPMSRTYSEWFMLGLTIVDSLDTLWLMNMMKEYKEAREWVANELTFDKPVSVNLFETTIRVLGGLLSIFHLTKDKMYLEKAADLGDRLMGAFTSLSKIPYSDVTLGTKRGRPPAWGSDSSLSEVSTIQLEFNDLSYSLQNPSFRSAAYNVMLQIFSLHRPHGLCPIFINADSGEFTPASTITLGARGDSYYEYLLKQWIQTGKTDDKMKSEYITAMEGVKKLLIRRSFPSNLTFVGELLSGRSFSAKMDHLVCFLPGTLALGYYHGLPYEHMELAKELIETCYQMYARMATGLSPEIAHFQMASTSSDKSDDIIVKPLDAHNLLRPETVESLHIMYQITKENKYREYGWNIFKAFNKYCKVPTGGYVSINDVRNAQNPRRGEGRDKMESFFLGETLKYLYLLFSDDDIIPLDKFVFNTEAHPLPVFNG